MMAHTDVKGIMLRENNTMETKYLILHDAAQEGTITLDDCTDHALQSLKHTQ